LYDLDSGATYRFSHENPAVAKLYEEFLEEPLSKTSHKYLHTTQVAWTLDKK
ncbi:MAG: iron hydrogenase small subunit, partial [Christensenellaceae bacterium]|nr:iron hydrogenase small subunit [Christensenellaceae bacterium]